MYTNRHGAMFEQMISKDNSLAKSMNAIRDFET